MKGGIYILALLLAAVTVSASYLPVSDIQFRYRSGVCDDNGSIFMNITHEGKNLKFSDIKFTIYSDELEPQQMIGHWYLGSYPLENYLAPEGNYTGSDYVNPQLISFKTTNNIYTKGRYTVTLSWPSNTVYQDNVKFAIECPEKKCDSDMSCTSQQTCTNNTCQWLKCGTNDYASGHACLPVCNDNNKCTHDYYVENKCLHAPIAKCCDTDSDCSIGRECKDNDCVVKPVENLNIFMRFLVWLKSRYE